MKRGRKMAKSVLPDTKAGRIDATTKVNAADLKSLLHLLNTAAEATSLEAKGLKPRPTARGRPPDGPIGYTSVYRDPKYCDIETEPVVASHWRADQIDGRPSRGVRGRHDDLCARPLRAGSRGPKTS